MSRRRKITFAVVLLILASVIGWPVWSHYEAKWTVARYERELGVRGEKLTLAALVPPPPASASNGARELIAAVNQLGSFYNGNTVPAMRYVVPGRALAAAQQEVLPTEFSLDVWPGLGQTLAAERQALANLRAALKNPVLDFNLDYSQGSKLPLGHLTRIRTTAQWLSAATLLELHEGHSTNALENLNALTRLVARYRDEPLMISELVRLAIGQNAVNAAWEVLQARDLPDEPLAELQATWGTVDLLPQAETALAMERILNGKFFDESRESFSAVNAARAGSLGAGQNSVLVELADLGNGILTDPVTGLKQITRRYPGYWAWKWWWSYEDELVNMQIFQAGIEAARTAGKEDALLPALRQMDQATARIRRLHPQAGTWLEFPFDPVIQSFYGKIVGLEMQRKLVLTAIALKRYQLRHGQYPPDLTGLVPEFLHELPRDAMDGKPLRYRLETDGSFLLYSAGQDGEDNGGDATPMEKFATLNKQYWAGRDGVWPRPASPEEVRFYRATVRGGRRRGWREPSLVITNGMSETARKELETLAARNVILLTNSPALNRGE